MDDKTREALMALTAEVARLSTRMDAAMSTVEAYVNRDEERARDMETRMRKVEQWLHALPVALILAAGQIVFSIYRARSGS